MAFQNHQVGSGRLDQTPGLIDIHHARDTARFPGDRQRQGFLPRLNGVLDDPDLRIVLDQVEVADSYLSDDRLQHRDLSLFRRQHIGARRFRRAAELAEEVQLPGKKGVRAARDDVGTSHRIAESVRLRIYMRVLRGMHHHQLALRFDNALRGDADIVVCLESLGNEGAEGIVLEQVKPLHVAERNG